MYTLLPLAALFVSTDAHAVGIGTSITLTRANFWTYAPTLDLLFDPVVVQIHLTETLDEAFENDLYLGADVVVQVVEAPITNNVFAVLQPGGALWIDGDPTAVSLAAIARAGVEVGSRNRVGVYVVPYLGLTIEDGDTDLFASGGAQFAVSFAL